MIESILLFALGFLCAGLLALIVAPAIWRRAVNLTRRGIEASMPLTLNEIQAGKDRLRAEFAMSTRRLEMKIKTLNDKIAEQMVELGRSRRELDRHVTERDEKQAAVAAAEAQIAELREALRRREDELRQVDAQLQEAGRMHEERAAEINRLESLYDEASFAASGRQIELVARESEIEKLTGDISRMKRQHRDASRELGAVDGERKSIAGALAAEKKRVGDLEGKMERLLSTIADRDEKLERREKELARLQGPAKGAGAAGNDTEGEGKLQSRLAVMARENKRLRAELAASEKAPGDRRSEERRASTLLREQISDLAAEVVAMTIALDGKDSAAARAVETPGNDKRPLDADGKVIVSLADRVRALQKAARK